MELRKKTQGRVYVEDDLPSFIRRGPSMHMMKHAGTPDAFAPLPPDPIHEVTLSNGYRSSDRYLKEKTPEAAAGKPNLAPAPALKNWDNRFLLTIVGIIVSLNAILYISFHPASERSQLQRIGGRSVLIRGGVAPIPTLEDRVVTLKFTGSSYTEELTANPERTEVSPALPILQQP